MWTRATISFLTVKCPGLSMSVTVTSIQLSDNWISGGKPSRKLSSSWTERDSSESPTDSDELISVLPSANVSLKCAKLITTVVTHTRSKINTGRGGRRIQVEGGRYGRVKIYKTDYLCCHTYTDRNKYTEEGRDEYTSFFQEKRIFISFVQSDS
mgnify:CR=1 FL=1